MDLPTKLFGKRSLDERLLSGELSTESAEARARAEELVSPRHRAKCAKALRELVEEGSGPTPRSSTPTSVFSGSRSGRTRR